MTRVLNNKCFSEIVLCGFLSLIAAYGAGCGEGEATVVVETMGLPGEVDHILACSRREDGRYRYSRISPSSPTSRTDMVVKDLPLHYSGSIKVLFEARSADGCVLARDSRQIELSNGRAQATLNFPISPTNPLAGRVCKVSFLSCGVGRGTLSLLQSPPPDGLAECPSDPESSESPQERSVYVKYGEPLSLTALAGAGAHFAAWKDVCQEEQGLYVSPYADADSATSPCRGQGATCQLPKVTGPLRLRAQFNLGLCPPTGLCWENPLPQGNDLWGAWSASDGSLFAVGSNGTVLRNSAQVWQQDDAGIANRLLSVSGSSPSDLFAVGDGGTVVHFDGVKWHVPPGSALTTESLRGVYAGIAGLTFVVGDNGTLLKGSLQDTSKPWNVSNSKWSSLSANVGTLRPAFAAVFGTAADRVYAVSGESTVHVGGIGGWNTFPGQPLACGTGRWSSIWGVGSTFLLAGAAGQIAKFDGTSCVAQATGRTERLAQVFGSGSERYALGDAGLVLRQVGSSWQPVVAAEQKNPLVPPLSLYAGASGAAGDYLVVGEGGVMLRGNAAGISVDPSTQDPQRRLAGKGPILANLRAVAGRGDVLWAVGDQGTLLKWDGRRWSEVENPDDQNPPRRLNGLWVGESEVWAVGDAGAILRYDGSTWKMVEAPANIRYYGVAATNSELWLVGELGRVFARPLGSQDGGFDERPPNASNKSYFGVWADGEVVCAVSEAPGSGTNVLCGRGRGTRLVEFQETMTQAPMYAIWGTSPTDIWVAGEEYILHRKGPAATDWEKFGPYAGQTFLAIAGTADGVFAVGLDGTAVRCRAPMGCQTWPTGTDRNLHGLYGSTTGELIAVGMRGAILRNRR